MKRLGMFAALIALVLSGCATQQTTPIDQAKQKAMILPPTPLAAIESSSNAAGGQVVEPGQKLADGIQNLARIAGQLETIETGMTDWWKKCGAKKRSHFTSEETDQIGNLLFQFLMSREMLWNMISLYGNCERNFEGAQDQTRAFAIAYGSALLLDRHSAKFVLQFIDEPKAVKKMNEIHYRYDIPADTYDSILRSVTSPDNVSMIREARRSFVEDSRKSDSTLAMIAAREPEYAELLKNADKWFEKAKADTDTILKKKSILLPDVANLLRNNWLAEHTLKVTKNISDNLYIAQGLLFNNVSDIKRPKTPPSDFNPDQVKLIKSLIQSGDLIFCFTAGYMSNVFLPGKFKHGITYIGTPEQRIALGLSAGKVTNVPASKRAKLEKDLLTAKLETGYDADVIEAVAEGVIFNSLDYLLKTHINRVAILRPRVSRDDRVQALGTTFLLLGSMYDFNFDFVDTSYQCCTEVIYRSYNKRGGIDFKLIPRMNILTLAADDIIEYHLAAKEPLFDLILFAEENPKSPIHQAIISTGDEAASKLKKLMTQKLIDIPIPINFQRSSLRD